MLYIKDKQITEKIKAGKVTEEDLGDYFLNTMNIMDLARSYARLYMEKIRSEKPQIVVSEEEYNRIMGLFKIRGIKTDGSEETRGRRAKSDK